jgi:hypothetical protein
MGISAKRARLVAGVIYVLCWGGPAAGQYVPGPYEIEEEFDKEYGMDLVQLSYDRDWNRIWETHDRGFRVSMGSLNVRQYYADQEVKFAADFTDWLRFLYRYDRYEGLHPLWEERQRNDFELEVRPWRWFKIGVRTEPTFWKRYADIGATGKFHYGPDKYVDFAYTAIDFDNNYSFEHSNYDEGYEEIYGRQPRRYEVAASWALPAGFRVCGEGFYRTPSTKYHTFFYGQEPDRARRYAEKHAAFSVWKELPAHVDVFYEGEANRWEETRRLVSPPTGTIRLEQDYDGRMTLESHGGGAYFQPPGRHRLRGGGHRRRQTRHFYFTYSPYESYDYVKTEWVYYLMWQLRVWRGLYLETGYMGEQINAERFDFVREFTDEWCWYENRMPIALEYKFSDKIAFKMSSGFDLDKRDWGQYLYYDKGYAFVIACF